MPRHMHPSTQRNANLEHCHLHVECDHPICGTREVKNSARGRQNNRRILPLCTVCGRGPQKGVEGFMPRQIRGSKFRCGKCCGSLWSLCGKFRGHSLKCCGVWGIPGLGELSHRILCGKFCGQFETQNFPHGVDCPRNTPPPPVLQDRPDKMNGRKPDKMRLRSRSGPQVDSLGGRIVGTWGLQIGKGLC